MSLSGSHHPMEEQFLSLNENDLREYVETNSHPRLNLTDATVRFEMADPSQWAPAKTPVASLQFVQSRIDDFLEAGLFPSHYIQMLDHGVGKPIVVDMTGKTPCLREGEMRCAIALARKERVPAIIIEGVVEVIQEPALPVMDLDY